VLPPLDDPSTGPPVPVVAPDAEPPVPEAPPLLPPVVLPVLPPLLFAPAVAEVSAGLGGSDVPLQPAHDAPPTIERTIETHLILGIAVLG